ncbi:MAG TPA: two-component regulator propeller domain-containing protein [Candidatus Polarisedimenticolia bacterium]|nr:two-component regulator propeller domain-containing protein [Candidatus Polarisedimenticolia bacterium]
MPKLKIAGRACLALLFFSLLYAPAAKAEDSSKDVQFIPRILTVNDGLPPGVESIAQTQDGYMWFATQDGVARFDGAQFRIFDKNNTPGINQNYITVLLADQARGTLWIGTYGGGLTRYQSGSFKSYTTSDGLPGNFIFELAQGPAQELLIGTDKGLAVFKNEKIEQVQLPGEALNKRVAPITASPDGSAWFLYEGAIYRMDKVGKISKPEFQVSDANTIYADHEANIWVGTRTHGLYEWSGGKTTHYSNASSLAQPPIRAIYQDHKGKIWVEIYKAGLCQPRPGGTFDCYTSKDGLPENNVVAIYEDHEGNLWLAAEEYGVIRLRVNNFFTHDERRGLSNNNVLSIHESNDGTLWVGSRPGLTRIQDGRITTIKIASTVPGNTVSAIEEAGNGDLWLGTQEGLKLLHDGKVIRTFTTPDGWASNSVTALFRDHQGNLWMGNEIGGLTRYAHGKFTRLTQKDGLLSTWIRSVMEDHEGTVWFSTAQGVTRFKNGEFNNIPLAAGENGTSTGVNCMYEDDEHVFWLGTFGSGLVRFSNGKFVSFRQKDGLLDDTLWSIVEDGSRNLWMSSNRGLFRVSKSSLDDFASGRTARISSTVYGVADGLPTTDFNGGDQTMGLRTREGKLIFATSRGVVEVDPSHLRTNPLAPPVVIEESLINQMQVPDQVSVPVGRGELEFHFAGLSFVEPSRVVSKYKLEGFDKGWISSGGRHTAYYTNIPPGKYQFRVMAANNDGVWNEAGASLNFTLSPKFYQTNWFLMLCATVTVVLGLLAYQWRVRQVTAHLDWQFQERLSERMRIAQDLHDTLLQGFLSASMQLHVADDQLPADSPAKALVSRVLELMRHVIEEGRNALRGLRSAGRDAYDLETEFSRIQEELALSQQVGFRVIVEGMKRPLRPVVRDEVYLIGHEALVNAFRHSGARNIEVELGYESSHLRMLTRDDGCGIDSHVLRSGREGHWGLSGMHERAERIGGKLRILTRASAGTEVELVVPSRAAFESQSSDGAAKWFSRLYPVRRKNDESQAGSERNQ